MQPAEIFDVLVKGLAATLRQHGFSRRRQTYYRREAGNWGLVNIQKSMYSTAQQIRFTINLGIFSERIGSPYRARSGGPPSEMICHWRQRIGALLPVRDDCWWEVDSDTSADSLICEITHDVVDLALPEIDRYITDESLRDLWLTGRAHGIGDWERLRFLAVLLEALGLAECLPPVLEALRHIP